MPIYEFLCPACNRVFSFLVKSTSERRDPTCPKCGGRDMRRRMSRFAVTGVQRKSSDRAAAVGERADGPGSAEGGVSDPLDNPQVEAEMSRLMDEADGIDENDPRQLGRLMRRMTEISGERLEPGMEEAVRRLEAGEDPEKIEEDLGAVLGEDDADAAGAGSPSYDSGLYDL